MGNEVEARDEKPFRDRDDETFGHVPRGRAELHIDGWKAILELGDAWVAPADAEHRHRVLESLTAIERATRSRSDERTDSHGARRRGLASLALASSHSSTRSRVR